MLDYFDAYAASYQPYKGGAWCYEDGCIYRGLVLLHAATGELRWRAHLLRLIRPQITVPGGMAGYRVDDYNIDNLLAGRALFPLSRWTDDPCWMRAVQHLHRQLATHPRTPDGNFWHKLRYPHQVWLDGLYMALPFQIELGQFRQDTEMVQDALAQLRRALDVTRRHDGLYAHGFDAARVQDWADPETGQSASVWARAIGWQAMAMVDCAELVGGAAFSRAGLAHPLQELLHRIAQLQATDGGWLQVMDQPDLSGNYTESSASAMFAYAFATAMQQGVSSPALVKAHRRALTFLEGRLKAIGDSTRFHGICHVAGLGRSSGGYRDGSAGYYLTEAQVSDDAKGTGPLMMAYARLIQLENNKEMRAS
ncbi:glycoside hydrolase family 88/105 protein [Roseinatronobacter sp.]|uniref:glycoside hydrolase family 88/105 protein n=1 Tax=Roseinatronobacter sp. TaxID=1945755 RepID=UPI003F6F3F4A